MANLLNLRLLFFGGKEEEHGWKASRKIVRIVMAFKNKVARYLKERIEQEPIVFGGKIITITSKIQWEQIETRMAVIRVIST